jgi:hypothetical protein
MILRQLRANAANLLQGLGPDRIVATYTEGSPMMVVARLEGAVQAGFRPETGPGGPTLSSINIAKAGGGHIANTGVEKGPQHLLQIARFWLVIGIQLANKIVGLVANGIVEIGQITLLTAGAPGPAGAMVIGLSLPTGHSHPLLLAPGQGFWRGGFIR